jgi:hypothetical protein
MRYQISLPKTILKSPQLRQDCADPFLRSATLDAANGIMLRRLRRKAKGRKEEGPATSSAGVNCTAK